MFKQINIQYSNKLIGCLKIKKEINLFLLCAYKKGAVGKFHITETNTGHFVATNKVSTVKSINNKTF